MKRVCLASVSSSIIDYSHPIYSIHHTVPSSQVNINNIINNNNKYKYNNTSSNNSAINNTTCIHFTDRQSHPFGKNTIFYRNNNNINDNYYFINSYNHQYRCFSIGSIFGRGNNNNTDINEELAEATDDINSMYSSNIDENNNNINNNIAGEEVDEYIKPYKSILEQISDAWDYITNLPTPVDMQITILKWLHSRNNPVDIDNISNNINSTEVVEVVMEASGISWGVVLIGYGICMRLITLMPSLYTHRNALRLNTISAQIQEIDQNIKRVKSDKTMASDERTVVQAGYNRVKKSLYAKHKCSQLKSMAHMATVPVMMSAFMAVNRMTMYERDLETATFFWVTDLTMPDPTVMLPLICGVSFVTNFELTQSLQKGARGNSGIYIRWGMRTGVVVFIYFFSSQPSALFCYWLGTGIGGVVQPILLRSNTFRKYCDFPDPPSVGKAALSGSRAPTLMDRMFKSKEAVEEMQRKHSEAMRVASEVKLGSIDDFDIVVDKQDSNLVHVNKKSRKRNLVSGPGSEK